RLVDEPTRLYRFDQPLGRGSAVPLRGRRLVRPGLFAYGDTFAGPLVAEAVKRGDERVEVGAAAGVDEELEQLAVDLRERVDDALRDGAELAVLVGEVVLVEDAELARERLVGDADLLVEFGEGADADAVRVVPAAHE